MLILHLDCMTFYRDTTFTLQVHVVKHLPFRYRNCLRPLQQSVRKSGLSMVNVGNNAEVSYIIHIFVYVFMCKVNVK